MMLDFGKMNSQDLNDAESQNDEQPWHFWKWLIPVYAAVLCVSMLLFLSYWFTVFGSPEFLIYIGNDSDLIYDFLPTVPIFCMLVEYPFNMIQLDWPMLIFVEFLFALYVLLDFVHVSFRTDHLTVYPCFNWYGKPLQSFGYVCACFVLLALFFAFFWAISNKVKLPRYARRTQRRYDSMNHNN